MAKISDFNPNAVVVVRKRQGLKIGGRLYEQGQAVTDGCLSLRKRQQLFAQNHLCYPHELEGALEDSKQRQADNVEGLEGDGTGDQMSEDGVRTNNEAAADEAADDSRPEGYVEEEADDESEEDKSEDESEDDAEGDDDKSGEEGSEEPSKPVVASKKKRTRKKKS